MFDAYRPRLCGARSQFGQRAIDTLPGSAVSLEWVGVDIRSLAFAYMRDREIITLKSKRFSKNTRDLHVDLHKLFFGADLIEQLCIALA